jgi:hypothetical protein
MFTLQTSLYEILKKYGNYFSYNSNSYYPYDLRKKKRVQYFNSKLKNSFDMKRAIALVLISGCT